MKHIPTFDEFINESINEDAKVDSRIKDLAEDPKTHKALGISDVDKLKYALTQLFRRGYGAAVTNCGAVNPNIKKLGRTAALSAWGYARMNAFIQKTKGYETTDSDIADWLKGKGEKPKEKS